MRTSTRLQARQGFTLIELLVVISIIAILAGMLIPAIGMVQNNAKSQKSGKSMSGIVAAMLNYQSDEGGWPEAARSDDFASQYVMAGSNGTNSDPSNAHLATVGAFYVLTYTYPADVTSKLFTLPGKEKSAAPKGKPSDELTPTPEEWGWTGNAKIPYAFDWSASTTPGSNRVLVGDRQFDNIHTDFAVIVFGDGHVEKLTEVDRTGAQGNMTTTTDGGNPGVTLFAGAGDTDDNVWDDQNDAPDGELVLFRGRGATTRVWLK